MNKFRNFLNAAMKNTLLQFVSLFSTQQVLCVPFFYFSCIQRKFLDLQFEEYLEKIKENENERVTPCYATPLLHCLVQDCCFLNIFALERNSEFGHKCIFFIVYICIYLSLTQNRIKAYIVPSFVRSLTFQVQNLFFPQFPQNCTRTWWINFI